MPSPLGGVLFYHEITSFAESCPNHRDDTTPPRLCFKRTVGTTTVPFTLVVMVNRGSDLTWVFLLVNTDKFDEFDERCEGATEANGWYSASVMKKFVVFGGRRFGEDMWEVEPHKSLQVVITKMFEALRDAHSGSHASYEIV